jgi:hypothetical protein
MIAFYGPHSAERRELLGSSFVTGLADATIILDDLDQGNELLKMIEIGSDGLNLCLGQAMRNRFHES